jgi:hypothetical protein
MENKMSTETTNIEILLPVGLTKESAYQMIADAYDYENNSTIERIKTVPYDYELQDGEHFMDDDMRDEYVPESDAEDAELVLNTEDREVSYIEVVDKTAYGKKIFGRLLMDWFGGVVEKLKQKEIKAVTENALELVKEKYSIDLTDGSLD